VIIEGLDRCGKNEHIKFLCSLTENYTVRHFNTPQGNTDEEKVNFQKLDFTHAFSLVHQAEKEEKEKPDKLYIWNRSHIGEWVYGQKYRNYKPTWIWDTERFWDYHTKDNVYLIMLLADPCITLQNDDGNSLSAELKNRTHELELFEEAFELSNIPKKMKYWVTDGNHYKTIETIQNDLKQFIDDDV